MRRCHWRLRRRRRRRWRQWRRRGCRRDRQQRVADDGEALDIVRLRDRVVGGRPGAWKHRLRHGHAVDRIARVERAAPRGRLRGATDRDQLVGRLLAALDSGRDGRDARAAAQMQSRRADRALAAWHARHASRRACLALPREARACLAVGTEGEACARDVVQEGRASVGRAARARVWIRG